MANSLYVTGTDPNSGKVLVTLGMMSMLERTISRIGFFRAIGVPYRPVAHSTMVADREVFLIREVFNLEPEMEEMFGVSSEEAESMLARGQQNLLMERILAAYKKLEEKVDFVLCEGTDFRGVTLAVETDFNSDVARDLNVPVALVVDGSSNDPDAIGSQAKIGWDNFKRKGCEVLAVLVNKVAPEMVEEVKGAAFLQELERRGVKIAGVVPHEPNLAMPRMDQVASHLGGRVLFGSEHLHRKVGKTIVASGSVETMIPLLDNNVMLITHIDRHDAILMALMSLFSHAAPNIGGMVLTGERELAAPVARLLEGLPGPRIPIIRSPKNTYETVLALTRLRHHIEPSNFRELEIARQHFESNVDTEALASAIRLATPSQMSPPAFKFQLVKRAREVRKRIVLPEGSEERIIKAADALLRLHAVDLVLLGNEAEIRTLAGQLAVDLRDSEIVNPQACDWADEFARIYYEARRHKGMTKDLAREAIMDLPLFGTLMVHTGRVDGMVAGATTSTAATIRPAFQIIKPRRGCSIVSSVFFMCLADRVLVYGDCAVNPDPTADQLAEIAAASGETASSFGIEPIVAMLSYSTGESGEGADVDKVKAAVQIAKSKYPQLVVEGPLQYDAAVDVSVARTKLPQSQVGGRATVFIFPDLNTGNNTYKAVQRSARAVAIGPVLQGLNKPVNDLSRGCTVEDIVNTVAITAIQAR